MSYYNTRSRHHQKKKMSGPSDSPVRGTQALPAEFSPRPSGSLGDRSDMRGQASNVPSALPTSTVSHGYVVQRSSGNQDRAEVSRRDGSDRATGGSVRRGRSGSNDRGRTGNDRYHDSSRRGESGMVRTRSFADLEGKSLGVALREAVILRVLDGKHLIGALMVLKV